MRKSKFIVAICLVVVILVGMTACGYPAAHPDVQRQEAEKYIETYLCGGTITDVITKLKGRSCLFMVKDKQGFDYQLITTEVPLSDLGFKDHDSDEDKDLVFITNNYASCYLYYLIKNLDKDAVFDLTEQYKDAGFNVIIQESDTTLGLSAYNTCLVINNLDTKEPIERFTNMLKEHDVNNMLDDIVLSVYSEEPGAESEPIGYYDFYFGGLYDAEAYGDMSMLHDYLYALGAPHPVIKSYTPDASSHNVKNKDFTFLTTGERGTYVEFALDGVDYEFHPSIGLFLDDAATDEFGIYQGSLLSIIPGERSGMRAFYIAMFARQYPDYYQRLNILCAPIPTETEQEDE